MQYFSNIDIHQIINFSVTFDYDLQRLNILVKFFKKWEVSKIFFTRQIDINGSNEPSTLLRPKINILTLVSFGDCLLLIFLLSATIWKFNELSKSYFFFGSKYSLRTFCRSIYEDTEDCWYLLYLIIIVRFRFLLCINSNYFS